jgi:urea transport system substrate-binding protein
MPVASCSLSEPELIEIGPAACAGHISSSVYFESIGRPRNAAFVAAYRRMFPNAGPTSADAESSYLAVHLLARALRRARGQALDEVRGALAQVSMEAPQGHVHIDRDNRHSYLTPRIGISNARGGFDIIYEAPAPVKPDPYLVWHDPKAQAERQPPVLRVVK